MVDHRPSRIKLLQDVDLIHEKGHHWHRFPPTHYVEPRPVERIPVAPPDPGALCRTGGRRFVAWLGQYMLYLSVAVPLAFVPARLITDNAAFTRSAVLAGLAVRYMFIRVHDVIHHPGERARMERRGWFRFLDRHHYIHHVDNRVNLNFLLPLCDLLFGTMRTELAEEEGATWPSFEQAETLEVAPDHAGESPHALPPNTTP